jgi:hypothetical protein
MSHIIRLTSTSTKTLDATAHSTYTVTLVVKNSTASGLTDITSSTTVNAGSHPTWAVTRDVGTYSEVNGVSSTSSVTSTAQTTPTVVPDTLKSSQMIL